MAAEPTLENEMATAVRPNPPQLSLHKQESVDSDRPAGRRGHLPAQFSLQSQASTISTAAKVKPVTLRVYTMKESVEMTFTSGRFTTATQIMDKMLELLNLPPESANVFAIWLSSKHLQLQLKSYHLPCKLFKRWKDLLSQFTNATYEEVCEDEPLLYLERNTFLTLKEERKLLDPNKDNRKVLELLYHEAVFNITNARRYPVSRDDLHTLAGLQAAEFAAARGTTDPSKDTLPPLSSLYPPYMLKTQLAKSLLKLKFSQSEQAKEIQERFDEAFRSAWRKTTDPHNLRVLYLQLCWSMPFYGSKMFRGQIERHFNPLHILSYHDKQIVVAINTQGLHLFKSSTPPEVLLYLTYDQLSWEFEPTSEEGEDFYSSLWLEFDSVMEVGSGEERKVSKRMRIFSRQAPMMDAMISRCVEDIDKQEAELRRKRLEQGNQEILPDVSIKTYGEGESPRSQKQGKNFKEHKLPCTVYSPEGTLIQSDFTLTRVLKKRKSKPVMAAAQPQPNPEESTVAVSSTEGQPLQSVGRQRTETEGSKESNTEL